ncbi:hypothetical protein [Chlamydia vaughanii]|uniref:hypothetical protein n=1 Tax=Chlamydia vaughanii TaxID=3112552 RepID=UPI0032B2AA39
MSFVSSHYPEVHQPALIQRPLRGTYSPRCLWAVSVLVLLAGMALLGMEIAALVLIALPTSTLLGALVGVAILLTVFLLYTAMYQIVVRARRDLLVQSREDAFLDEITQLHRSIMQTRTALEECQFELGIAQSSLSQTEVELNAATITFSKKDNELNRLKDLIQRKDQALSETQQQIAQLQRQLQDSSSAVDILNLRVAELSKENQELSSTSPFVQERARLRADLYQLQQKSKQDQGALLVYQLEARENTAEIEKLKKEIAFLKCQLANQSLGGNNNHP